MAGLRPRRKIRYLSTGLCRCLRCRQLDQPRPVTARQLWLAVARIRRQAGDLEGALRAREHAARAVPIRRRAGFRAGLDPLRSYRTHWQPWAEQRAACNIPARKLTADATLVDCRNCKRSRWWPTV